MSRRIALASLLIALGFGLALFLWSRPAPTERVEDPENGVAAAGAQPNTVAPVSEPSALEPSIPVDRSIAAPSVTREPAEAVLSEADSVELSGTVVVSDSHGVEHASEDGYFHLYAPQVQLVEVNHGRWSARIPKDLQVLGIRRVEMDHKVAISQRTGMVAIPVPKDLRLDLRVSWPFPVLLHVQGRDTGLELAHVELVRQPRMSSSTSAHPGEFSAEDVVVADASSPMSIELGRVEKHEVPGTLETYYVRAPGCAWEHVVLNYLSGGERTVTLERAADLDVLLEGIRPSKLSYLRVRKHPRRSDSVEAEFRIGDKKRIAVDSLRPGTHTVSVEIGERGDEGPVLASKEVWLSAGERTQLDLVLEQPPPSPKVPLEGVLVLPSEWGISDFRIAARLVKPDGGLDRLAALSSREMHRAPEDPDAWKFAFAGVRPGVHEVDVHPLQWTFTARVGEEGCKDVRLEVPPPAQLSLRFVESETGKEASIDAITWSVEASEDSRSSSVQWAQATPERGHFEFRTPSGTLKLEADDERFEPFSKSIALAPGRNHLTFELAKACGVALCARDKGETRFLDERSVVLRRLDGKGEGVRVAHELSRLRITVSSPGQYRLTILDQEGYARVPPKEIQIEPGRFVDVDVDLQRNP